MTDDNPLAVLTPEPVGLPAAPKSEGKVTEDEAVAACKALGLKPIRVRRLAKNAVIGKFMAQLGATQIGTGKLLLADQQIEKGLRLCDRFLSDYPHEPEVVSSLMKVRLGLTEALLKSAHTLIKVNKDSGVVSEFAPPVNAFPPNVPVTVNTQVNLVANPPEQT